MKIHKIIKFVIQFQLLFIFIMLPVKGIGKIIHVPSDFITIQEALKNALEGDTVQVAPGRYMENIKWPDTDDITLEGAGENNTIIDGGKIDSVVSISAWDIFNLTIKGLTITNGRSFRGEGGGIGISCYNSSLTLSNVTVSNNRSFKGGGIYCYNSSLTLSNVTVSNNRSVIGGGIYCYKSSPTLSNVTISNNSAAEDGGGIYFIDSKPIFNSTDRCNIYFNDAIIGNDIYNDTYSDLSISITLNTFTVIKPNQTFMFHHKVTIQIMAKLLSIH